MNKGLNYIILGFLFVIIDINIYRVDVFADFIGYFIVLRGVRKLESQGFSFPWVNPLLIYLPALSIPNTIQWEFLDVSQGLQPTPLFILNLINTTVFMVLNLIVGMGILQGLRLRAIEAGNQSWADKGQKGVIFYIVSTFLLLITLPFILNTTMQVGTYLFIGIGIAYIIIQLIYLIFLRTFRISS